MISIGIIEDDPDMRAFLRSIIDAEEGVELCFEAENLAEAKQKLRDALCDLYLVDINLPDGTGLDFIRHVKERNAGKCLILTMLGDKTSVLQALQVGAHGYLLKDTEGAQIIKDIKATMAGDAPISPRAAAHLLQVFQSESDKPQIANLGACCLNDRERDILGMFARGLSYKETARVLEISLHTVNDYVKSIYSKLDVHSKSEAVFEANAQGWLEL